MEKRIWIIALLATFISLESYAHKLDINGNIYCKKTPIEFANIVLKKMDSTFVSGVVSNEKGNFCFQKINKGKYLITVSCVGYSSKTIEISHPKENNKLNIELDCSAYALDEVCIQGNPIIEKANKRILIPTDFQIKSSSNGFNLLRQLRLPYIYIDEFEGKVNSTLEGEIQFRINDRKVDLLEIRSLRPKDILKVEYHENPSLRYGDKVAVVIDYITKKPTRGGFVGINTLNSPNNKFGNNDVTLKYNHKNSELALSYMNHFRFMYTYWRENKELFKFADGKEIERIEEGIPDKFRENKHLLKLNYNLRLKNNNVFNAQLNMPTYAIGFNNKSNLFSSDNPENKLLMKNFEHSSNYTPSLDLYYKHSLKNKQALLFNLVASYKRSNSNRTYKEIKEDDILTDIVSDVEGKKYSIIGEALYEKNFKKSTIDAGMRYYYGKSDNTYSGNIKTNTTLKDANYNLFLEFSSKIKKFSYSIGLTGRYDVYEQNNLSYDKFSFTPNLKLKYIFNDHFSINYSGEIGSVVPNLSDLNDVTQIIDSLQIKRGNPNLKISTSYRNYLHFNFQSGIFRSHLFVKYIYSKNAIMEDTYRENNQFIKTINNQDYWQYLMPELSINVGPINNWLDLSFNTGYNIYWSKGKHYNHYYRNWFYRAGITATFKRFSFHGEIYNDWNSLHGETITYGENIHQFSAMYKLKNLSIGVAVMNPFSKENSYKRPTISLNKYHSFNSSWTVKNCARIFTIHFSWNLNFGRKYNSAEKKLNNIDDRFGTFN